MTLPYWGSPPAVRHGSVRETLTEPPGLIVVSDTESDGAAPAIGATAATATADNDRTTTMRRRFTFPPRKLVGLDPSQHKESPASYRTAVNRQDASVHLNAVTQAESEQGEMDRVPLDRGTA